MRERIETRIAHQAWLPYVALVLVTLLAAVVILRLPDASLDVPFVYQGDAVFYQTLVKGMVETGSTRFNPVVGAPGGLDYADFPMADGLHLLLIRLLTILTGNAMTSVNLFYLLTYPLAGVLAYWSYRFLGIPLAPAAAMSVLYAFLPFHLVRGESHLFLSGYYVVPVALAFAGAIARGRPLPIERNSERRWSIRDFRSAVVAGVVCLLLGMSGFYWAFFSCFFFVVSGLIAFARDRRPAPLVNALAGVLVVAISVGAAIAPTLQYERRYGRSAEAPTERTASDAELYSVRISQLVLPVTGHRSALADAWKSKSHQALAVAAPAEDNENDTSSLGLLGALGFIGLLAALLFPASHESVGEPPGLLRTFAALNAAGLLLAVPGGLGFLFALFVSPHIRGYNRISVYVAFLALGAVALALSSVYEWLRARWAVDRRAMAAGFAAACVGLTLFGLWDQSAPGHVPDYGALAREFRRDRDFVKRVETMIADDTMVFQLPYMPFPGSAQLHNMPDYTHFKAYLHSDDLRWSYGAMRGREGDVWARATAAKAPGEMVADLRANGFGGLWVDTRGYADGGGGLISALEQASGSESMRSPDGVLVFMKL